MPRTVSWSLVGSTERRTTYVRRLNSLSGRTRLTRIGGVEAQKWLTAFDLSGDLYFDTITGAFGLVYLTAVKIPPEVDMEHREQWIRRANWRGYQPVVLPYHDTDLETED